MEKERIKEIESSLERAHDEFENQVKAFAKARGIEAHRARSAIRAINGVDMLAQRVAELMQVPHGEAAVQRARDVAGNGGDWTKAEGYGLAQWTLATVYRSLHRGAEQIRSGDLLRALEDLTHVGNSLIFAMEELQAEEKASAGSKGGSVAAAKMREVRDYAISLASERSPVGGWQSAPQAADAILSDLRVFARERGRSPSTRKVAEWLREAGIKKG